MLRGQILQSIYHREFGVGFNFTSDGYAAIRYDAVAKLKSMN